MPSSKLSRHAAALAACLACAVACHRASEPAPRPTALPSPPAPPAAAVAPPAPAPAVRDASIEDAAPSDAGASEAAAARAKNVPPDMLPVPGGTFIMGADEGGEPDEHPAHKVTIKGFLLDKTEVTNGEYLKCVHAHVCRMWRTDAAKKFGAGPDRNFRHPDQPVSAVSWDDANTYCKWRGKRLPTEAEWEHAARGNDGRKYPWGDEKPDGTRACFSGSPAPCNGHTAPVGSYPKGAGPYGHLDLAGNVWEWTASFYDPFAYTRPTADRGIPASCPEILKALDWLRKHHEQGFTGSNPIPTVCEHVLRGGAYNYVWKGLRSSNRVHHPGRFRIVVAGFRCAKDW
jgi:formylglycine-generating enzyme required for sulfatase activity